MLTSFIFFVDAEYEIFDSNAKFSGRGQRYGELC
jgi:hypothetical protein